MKYVSFYQKSICSDDFEKALDSYLSYCEDNEMTPEYTEDQWVEVGDVTELDEAIVSHVLYHAEMNDFPVEEYLI